VDKVRCGVIGTGGMGSAHCRIIQDIPEVELTAVCDIDAEVCKSMSEKYGVPGFINHKELLTVGWWTWLSLPPALLPSPDCD
jgi:predicted dehydrogenase